MRELPELLPAFNLSIEASLRAVGRRKFHFNAVTLGSMYESDEANRSADAVHVHRCIWSILEDRGLSTTVSVKNLDDVR